MRTGQITLSPQALRRDQEAEEDGDKAKRATRRRVFVRGKVVFTTTFLTAEREVYYVVSLRGSMMPTRRRNRRFPLNSE